ncbi:MAG: hypothetical protein JNM84_03225 [Planctomycetes bacterium]|nr:hypothetical protein [Planctomycetota bacterium]
MSPSRHAAKVAASALALLMFAALVGCSDQRPIPRATLHWELSTTAREVVFGAPFELRCVRRHARSLDPEPFDPRALAPLVVEERERLVREDEEMREETLLLEARAFTLERVVLGPLLWRAIQRSDGAEQLARTQRLELAVRSSLRPGDGPQPELPFAPRMPRATWPLWLAAAAALGALAFLARRQLRRAPRVAPAPPVVASEPVHERLARELAALAAEGSAAERDRGEAARFATALARIAREALATRLELPAEVLTRAEIEAHLARDPATNARERADIDALLRRCEWIQFARAGLRSGEPAALIAATTALVEALQPRAEAEA